MRMVPSHIRFALLATLAFGFVPCSARADSWNDLQVLCKELHIPQINQFIAAARTWEQNELGAQKDLGNLSDNVCPAYLKNPNAVESVGAAHADGTVTLRQYVAEQTRTFTNALDADAKGNTNETYLKGRFDAVNRAVARAGIDFGSTLCGAHIAERYRFIVGELNKVKLKTLAVKTKCPAAAATGIAQDLKAKSPSPAPLGDGGAGARRAPSGAKDSGQSTITGSIHPKQDF
jgi:hypothetical protein